MARNSSAFIVVVSPVRFDDSKPPSGPDQSNLSGASRKAKRSRWATTTPFRRSTASLSSPSIVTSSASAPGSSVTTAAGKLTTPRCSERSTSSLWLQCLQSCCMYLAPLTVGTLALAIGMLVSLSVLERLGAAKSRGRTMERAESVEQTGDLTRTRVRTQRRTGRAALRSACRGPRAGLTLAQ